MPAQKEYMQIASDKTDHDCGGNVKAVDAAGISGEYWTKLGRYDVTEDFLHNVHTFYESLKHKQIQQRSLLLKLPAEILLLVLRSLSRYELIRVAVTCQNLLKIILEIIASDIGSASGAWAGHNFTILGELTYNLPPLFYTDSLAFESVDLGHLPTASGSQLSSIGNRTQYPRVRSEFFQATDLKYKAVRPNKTGLFAWLSELEVTAMKHESLKESEAMKSAALCPEAINTLKHILLGNSTRCAPHEAHKQSQFYLRNLITHQSVRLCICDEEPVPHASLFLKHSQTVRRFSLSKVLDTMTRWSRNTRKFASIAQRVTHADKSKWPLIDWAGHSFDIVNGKMLENNCGESSIALSARVDTESEGKRSSDIYLNTSGGNGWQDVTTSVLLEVAWHIDRKKDRRMHSWRKYPDESYEDFKRRLGQRKEWIAHMREMRTLAIEGMVDADTLIENWSKKLEGISVES